MKTTRLLLAITSFAFLFAVSAPADIIPFDLDGTDGMGLLPGNENPDPTGAGTEGTGGEIGAGITFDTVTMVLQINIGWGSGNGFTDLTSTATLGHVHGATASTPPAAFTENASPLAGGSGDLHTGAGWNGSATSGGFQGSLTLSSAQATDLLAGRYYINVHTENNPGGEIRGHLVVVPEPAGPLAFMGLGAAILLLWRRRGSRHHAS